jgi:hypothetical protein
MKSWRWGQRRPARAASTAGAVMAGLVPAIHVFVVGSRVQVFVEIAPVGISGVDQAHLPGARPVFDVALALDGVADVLVELGQDETLEAIPASEAVDQTLAMLMRAARHIARHAGVERAVGPPRINVSVQAERELHSAMARVQNPTLFSAYFSVPSRALAAAGLIDPFVDVDVPLFIDPVLLEKSSNKTINTTAIAWFRKHFEILVRMLTISRAENDTAWKGARRQLDLSEPPENGLGYGGSGRADSSRPEDIREAILRTSKEIITLGASDPEMISLMGFFEEDVGPDTISDMTTTVIMDDLAAITEAFCLANSVPLFSFDVCASHKLPKVIDPKGRAVPIVLIPEDIVRELPIANDWSDIERAAMENARIRDRVNQFLAGIIRPTVVDRKRALRGAALGSPDDFDFFLAAVKENVSNYDPNLDALGYYRLKAIVANGFPDLKNATPYDLKLGPNEIMRVVKDTIAQFNLWEELWIGDKP